MRALFAFLGKTLLFLFLTSLLGVVLFRFVPVYFTPLMVIRAIEQVKNDEQRQFHHKWVRYDEISDEFKKAVIASEDQRFFEHNGFDQKEIKKAIEERRSGKRRRGASTISQQTAKNVFLWPRSSWLRKGLETYFTILIELIWSKERILHVYLNSIEMGRGVYGAEAAANVHFGTTAQRITTHQAALVAATLPNPLVYSAQQPSNYIYKRQAFIMGQMRNIRLPQDR